MRWVRWTAVLFVASFVTFMVGAVAEGFWGSDFGTNWIDQTFGFAMFLGAALTMISALLLLAAALVFGTPRLTRRLRHR